MELLPLTIVSLLALSLTQPLLGTKDLQPAKPCEESKCNLPDCRCASTDIPGGLSVSDTPQIVTISFDDDLREIDYENYYSKLFPNRTNPNGCPIGLTFFVSHNYTNYALLEDLHYLYGYEMADHSVDHREPTTWWQNATIDEWTHEIIDQQIILKKWGNISKGQIRGFRAPFLVTSENEIKVLYKYNFTYEASMGTDKMYWPFTLDYKSPICLSPATCPNNSYPGLWLVPNILYHQTSGYKCAMIDACTTPQTEEEWVQFFIDNFNRHYQGNRAPFGIYAHSAWFYYGPARINSMRLFLNKLQNMSDVYIITHNQLIEWVRNPTPLGHLKDFTPWQCPKLPPPRCSYKNPTCDKSYPNGFSLDTCTSPCPPKYPHYGDPYGN